jgi:hypothetical protein
MVARPGAGYLGPETEEVAMPNEMPAITMAFVLQIWFLGVLVAVGALAWRQAHPKDEKPQSERSGQ